MSRRDKKQRVRKDIASDKQQAQDKEVASGDVSVSLAASDVKKSNEEADTARRKQSYCCGPIKNFPWPTFWSAVAAFATIGLAVFAYKAWDESTRGTAALNEQLKTMQMDQRPWIGVPQLTMEKISADVVSLSLSFRNVGKSATYGLYIDATIVPERGPPKNALDVLADICAAGKQQASVEGSSFYVFSIAPNDVFLAIDPPRAKEFPRYSVQKLKEMESPHLVGCVVYGNRSDKSIHKTGFEIPLKIEGDNVTHGNIYAIGPD